VKTINITGKTGELISIMSVNDTTNDLMIITKNGITIRTPLANIKEAGRATQGVRLIKLNEGDHIAAVTKVMEAEEEEEESPEGTELQMEVSPSDTVEGEV
jgi:DNA gyrase subunit A